MVRIARCQRKIAELEAVEASLREQAAQLELAGPEASSLVLRLQRLREAADSTARSRTDEEAKLNTLKDQKDAALAKLKATLGELPHIAVGLASVGLLFGFMTHNFQQTMLALGGGLMSNNVAISKLIYYTVYYWTF
mmetsp:Transcript_43419/g.70451  ORF Transcript_43419/g.70451 Transcript_43419/m.70451 type:complete len:137 (+) Transcript_43419:53-463(+)